MRKLNLKDCWASRFSHPNLLYTSFDYFILACNRQGTQCYRIECVHARSFEFIEWYLNFFDQSHA